MEDLQLESQFRRDHSGGLQEYASPLLINSSACLMPSKNFDVSTPGVIQRGPGYSAQGGSESTASKGLFVRKTQTGDDVRLKLHNTVLKAWNGSAWSAVTGGSSFTNNNTDIAYSVNAYIDNEERLYIVTGHNDYFGYYDGTSWNSDPESATIYAKHIQFYKGRLYLMNVKIGSTEYASRTQFSETGVDTFDTDNDFFEDVGRPITGSAVFGDDLWVFTSDGIFRWNDRALYPVPASLGTDHGRSITQSMGMLYYYNSNGFWMSTGDAPQLISRPVQPILQEIGASTHPCAGADRFGRIYLWIGDITYKGTSYTDAVLRYDPLINAWDFQDKLPLNVMLSTIENGVLELFGDDEYTGIIDDTDTRIGENIDFEYSPTWFMTQDTWRLKQWHSYYPVTRKVEAGDSQALTVKYVISNESSFTTVPTTFTTSESQEFTQHKVELVDGTRYTPTGNLLKLQISKTSAKPLQIVEHRVNYGIERRPD